MHAEPAETHAGADCHAPSAVDIRQKNRLNAAVDRRVGIQSETVLKNRNRFHLQASQVECSQTVVHQCQMRIDRGVGDHYPVSHPDAVRREIPDAFDAVGDRLGAVDRHRDYAYVYLHFFDKIPEHVDMIDRSRADACSDDIGIDVDAGDDV